MHLLLRSTRRSVHLRSAARMASVSLTRFKLTFRVPSSHLEACKQAVFAAGAGRYPGSGNYTECCHTVMGTGQFRPGDAASPHIGAPGALEQVLEASVSTLCVGEDVARKAVDALKRAHPYEEPGYEVLKLEDF